jgi:large subunit ribosomal protein L4
MASLDIINQDKKKVGTIELNDAVFGVDVNVALVHQVLKGQLASRRQGTAKTKTKSEVRGGGRKPFKQKGTGNARQGSIRSPLKAGGGQSHGPVPRSYFQATPKKMVEGALRSALSDRLKANRLVVIDEFKLKAAKTSEMAEILNEKLDLSKVVIIDLIEGKTKSSLERASRNLPYVKVLRTEGLNVYDIIGSEWLVFTQKAAKAIETRLMPTA